jgi:SAM-dependent methyltransferase
MDLEEYRNREPEIQRIADIMQLLPQGQSVLDVGARDGYVSMRLAEQFEAVTALDLEKPQISRERIVCVQGDVTELQFPPNSFDVVVCVEVLEHIPSARLPRACQELVRVAKGHILIGVPFKQDIRVGRTTCSTCGGKNPPWGHVNTFDEGRLRKLFPGNGVEAMTFVGENVEHTNGISALLMDWAGNPYGTYSQEEPCIFCGSKLGIPPSMGFIEKVCAKLSVSLRRICGPFYGSQPNWVHMLFAKNV